ncbi:MAG: Hint domain-containing protein [Acetobacteraceae bacterium]
MIWVGSQSVRVHPDLSPDMAEYPVIIKAGAISEHVPQRDLRVTSEHCIALENRLIPVRMLVNGKSIFYDMMVTSYEAHHFETARHAIILAEGLGVETFLDTGNRNRFEKHVGITPVVNRNPDTAYMPALPIGMALPEMKHLWTRIAQRASTPSAPSRHAIKPGRRRPSPRLTILSESGAAYRLTQVAPNIFKTRLPASETKIAFESPSFRFCDLNGPYHDDRRRLGMLVEGIDITTDAKADGKARDVAFERGAGWIGSDASWSCWTNGRGELHFEPPENSGQMHMIVRVNADVLKPV